MRIEIKTPKIPLFAKQRGIPVAIMRGGEFMREGSKERQGKTKIKEDLENMEVKVLFFGVLAEVTGTTIKHYTDVKSIKDLKLKIEDDFPEVVHYNFRISVNNQIIDSDPILKNGDEVAFMPPFAGG